MSEYYRDMGQYPLPPSFDWNVHTFRNLAWHYGFEHAVAIQAGFDPATQRDLEAWHRVGRRK